MTADGDDPIVKKAVDLKVETQEIGTTTGDDHDVGTSTVDGIKTNDEAGTDVITVTGTETITLDGTEDGIFVYSTIASPDVIIIT
jgi:hypothetical protein